MEVDQPVIPTPDEEETILKHFWNNLPHTPGIDPVYTWEFFNAEWKKKLPNGYPDPNVRPGYTASRSYNITGIKDNSIKLWYLEKIRDLANTYSDQINSWDISHDFKISFNKLVNDVLGVKKEIVENKDKDLNLFKVRMPNAIDKLKELQAKTFAGRRRKPGSAKRKKKLGTKPNSKKKKQKKKGKKKKQSS